MANTKKPTGPGNFVTEAYSMKDDESMLDFYKDWADDYDKQMESNLGYTSPQTIAQALAKYFDDKRAAVLDIGCGTGLTANYLTRMGFTTIDGLDFSAEMVDVAGQKGMYRKLFVADLNKPLVFSDESYSAIISSGTFTHGHVGPEPIEELFRILKPQGVLACTVHQDLWQKAGFESKFKSLESENRSRKAHLVNGAFYRDGEPEGWFCVYKKV